MQPLVCELLQPLTAVSSFTKPIFRFFGRPPNTKCGARICTNGTTRMARINLDQNRSIGSIRIRCTCGYELPWNGRRWPICLHIVSGQLKDILVQNALHPVRAYYFLVIFEVWLLPWLPIGWETSLTKPRKLVEVYVRIISKYAHLFSAEVTTFYLQLFFAQSKKNTL